LTVRFDPADLAEMDRLLALPDAQHKTVSDLFRKLLGKWIRDERTKRGIK